MQVYQGKGVFSGVALGPVHLIQRRGLCEDTQQAADPQTELERFEDAKRAADEELAALFEKAQRELGEEQAMIVDIQRLMLEDNDFNAAVRGGILEEGRAAAVAVDEAGKQFTAFFASLDDPYMKARATDIADIAQRLCDRLQGRSGELRFAHPVIVVADDLTPSETLQMDKSQVLAFVVRRGSTSSHTAILARTMNIPCVVQARDLPLDSALSGEEMLVDGGEGVCYRNPDESVRHALLQKQDELRRESALLDGLRGLPTETRDGRAVRLYANIGGIEDLEAVRANDCEGVGLLRSEFLYLGRSDCPGEEELFAAYRAVVEGLAGKPVIIRTLDIGADKQVDYFALDTEENPALGLRGVRLCLERPELLTSQLRAIYRASAFGPVGVMFPMIASLWELHRCKELAAAVRGELAAAGVATGEVELGVMIETPAAVMIAADLAREVDFFSVGTNDLTQYTLAVDRQNSKLERYADPHHPAVLEMLRHTARAACEAGIWAGVCGELASDPAMSETLLDMGYTELSVSPPFTLALRKHIRDLPSKGDKYNERD